MRIPSLAVGLALLAPVLLAPSQAAAVSQWQRWEQTITTTRDYTANGGNPYRDLILRVQFTQASSGYTFTQDAFWTGAATPKSFRVRSAFPAGTWSWQVVSCQGTTGNPGQSCSTDQTWSPMSGSFTISANTSTGIRLYDRGFLTQLKNVTALGTTYSQILYGDQVTSFYWAGDTAWAAPPREIKGQTASWGTFLNDRKLKGFTTVLVAPAVVQAGPQALPAAAGFSFDQTGSCAPDIPNDCSQPRPAYWQAFDNLIQQANDKDIVVVIAGLIDPTDVGKTNNYPNQANALDFARYLAARLAGNHVIYSPGFDDKVSSTTQGGVAVSTVMNAVGNAIKTAAPRHLVTNHLAGAGTCPDYYSFSSGGWMTFYMFHSGHAFVANGVAGQTCPGWLGSATESPVQGAMRRAREMPLTLAGYTNPRLPNLNGEGPYDKYPITNDEVDNPYRVRQAGHLSSLSNAQGFTYGVTDLGFWQPPTPSSYFGIPSSGHMQRLITRFKDRAGLPAQHGWILNQVADPNHEKKMVLASDGSSLVLAYLPGGSPASITISTSALPDLTCSGTWTMKWSSPPDNMLSTQAIICTQGVNQVVVGKPAPPCLSPDCDWVLEIQRTGSAFSGPSLALGVERLQLWPDLSPQDGTSAIYGNLVGPAGRSEPFLISPAGEGFQQSPRGTRLADGYLVVWHAEGFDGSLYSVHGQKLDRNGQRLGQRFQINTYTEHDQRDPAVASDAAGNTLVVWSSYGQDGDLGGIFGQRFDRQGTPVGSELRVSVTPEGHQSRPQIGADGAGNFVVAWDSEALEAPSGSIGVRRFNHLGEPLTGEIQVASQAGLAMRLIDLEVGMAGDFVLRWSVMDSQSRSHGQFRQRFDPRGRPLEPPIQILE